MLAVRPRIIMLGSARLNIARSVVHDCRKNIDAKDMSFRYAILFSVVGCAAAAGLEGICAGRSVKLFFATLRFPPYAAPLWLWSIIGGIYYVIFCFVIFRLLRLT